MTSYFSKTVKDRNVKFWHNLHSSLQFVLSKFGFNIFDSLETMRFPNVVIWSVFHYIFRLKWKNWILMVSMERSRLDISVYTLFQIGKIFFHLQKSIFRWKMKICRFCFCSFFFQITSIITLKAVKLIIIFFIKISIKTW